MYMLMCVLNDPDKVDDVLDAWESVGITGATIFETTGIQRRRTAQQRIPLRYRLGPIIPHEAGHHTLMAIVNDEELVHSCLAATEELIGDLNLPNTGVFSAWPLAVIKGIPMQNTNEDEA